MIEHRLVEHDDRAPRTSSSAIHRDRPERLRALVLDRTRRGLQGSRLARDRDGHDAEHHGPDRAARLPDLPARAQGLRPSPPRSSACRRSASRVGKETRPVETYDGLRAKVLDAGEAGHRALPLQGPRRDERRPALGHHDGSGQAPADPRRRRGRRGRRPAVLDPDGRRRSSRAASFIEQNAKNVKFLDVWGEVRGAAPVRSRHRSPRPRPHRVARARARDALELSRLRDVGHRRPARSPTYATA